MSQLETRSYSDISQTGKESRFFYNRQPELNPSHTHATYAHSYREKLVCFDCRYYRKSTDSAWRYSFN
jgi:hypothetical protein